MFQVPSEDVMFAIGTDWVLGLGLDEDLIEIAGASHDWAHHVFGLSIACEGIVFAIQECLEADLMPDLDLFETLCVDFMVRKSDAFTFDDVKRVYEQLSTLRSCT